MRVAVTSMVSKRLGALPVAAVFLRRLDVAGIIDRCCPIREVADLSHGQVVEALIANRLTAPAPLVRVEQWAREWAVEEVFGLDPGLLNDDRLGRALDALAPMVDQVAGSVGVKAIAEYGIDTARLHWDMTSISLHGAYPEKDQDEEFPQVKYGHPKDRRVDLKQIQAGLGCAADGGVPLFARAFSGGAAEVSQVVTAIQGFKELAASRTFLMVGDCKLVSYDNLRDLNKAQVRFVAPLPASRLSEAEAAALDPAAATVVDYLPLRLAERANAPRETYRVLEDQVPYLVTGRATSDPPVAVRRILVHSSGNAAGQAQARANRLAKAAADLEKVAAGAGGRYYKTPEKIQARIGAIIAQRRVGDCLVWAVAERPDGTPTLDWHFDQQVLATQAKADGWYALITNQDPAEADAAAILLDYKGQPAVERRYSELKGPLAVAPLFLETNRRITALLHVLMLALLIYALIERQVRRELVRQGATDAKMTGLYPDNRRIRPTARMVLYHLSGLNLIVSHAADPPELWITRGVQIHLLDLLGINLTSTG
jgi:transposase